MEDMEMAKKYRYYTFEFKKQVIEKYFEGYSSTEVAKIYNIHRRRVSEWVKIVKEGGYEALLTKREKVAKQKQSPVEKSLEEKYLLLQLENEYLKKLLDLRKG
jgi:transposase-like protein